MALAALNAQQRDAATAPFGHNLIIASAGTGKTSTIVGRIAHLLQSGVPPEEILLLTFTNKAAAEMIGRLGRYFPEATTRKIEAGTFHAVSYRFLKSLDQNLTLKQPAELRTLFRTVYEERDFVRMGLEKPAFSASYLYERYQLWQNATDEAFEAWFVAQHPDQEGYIDAYLDLFEEFEAQKRALGYLSFNDLLLRTLEYLETHTLPYREVLVDEYQDTNTLQGRLIDAMRPESLFCVGDYDQSIYAFNGARIENIATFTQRYPDARIYTLKINYRSSAPILSLANRVIGYNERIYPKSLEVGKQGKVHPPMLLVYEDLFEQYRAIAQRIKLTLTPHEEIAVLFRNNASADGIEASLREQGIACKRKGGSSFFETKEVKFILDLMTLLHNGRDMMAFIHLFEYAPGVGSALAKTFYEALAHLGEGSLQKGLCAPVRSDLPKAQRRKSEQLGLFGESLAPEPTTRFADLSLPQSVREHPLLKHPRLSVQMLDFFVDFQALVCTLISRNDPATILREIIHSTLYERVVQQLARARARLQNGEIDTNKYDTARERIVRKARLLLDLAKPYRHLERFLNAMVLGGGELSEGEGVNLLTVHASKGLEFEEVYVVDLVDGRFPNTKMMSSVEEERRLFYVAVTRAKERLYLSYAKHDRIKRKAYEASQFLKEAGLIRD